MNLASVAKLSLAACLAVGLAFGVTPAAVARPKPPPPVIYAPPPPPPMPSVGLASRFVADAAVYASYLRDVGGISPAFTDAGAVAASLRAGVAYEPGQLRRGAISYAAVMALTDSAFVEDVRKAGQTPEQRYAIVARIYAHPEAALEFQDGQRAAGLAKRVLEASGQGIYAKGTLVRNAAYDIQHQPWSLAEVQDRDTRAAAVKSLSVARRAPGQDDVAALQQMISGAAPAAMTTPEPGPYPSMVTHAVALAALAAIGQAGDDDAERLNWLMDDYFADHCLAEAKLSLFECIAVAKPNYEDVFCLGQHALRDTGECIARADDTAVPIEVYPHPISIKPAHIRAKPAAAATHRKRHS